MKEEMLIIQDTREQRPYTFDSSFYKAHGVIVKRAMIACGDYGVHAPDGTKAVVERKELNDLVNCCGNDRERFMREMQRAIAYRAFCIVVEASWEDVAKHRYRSQIEPQCVYGTLFMIQSRFNIPVVFAGSRRGGEYACWQFLRQFVRGAEHFDKEMKKRVSQAQAQEEIRQAASKPAVPPGMVEDAIFGLVKPLDSKQAAGIRA